MVDVTSCVWFTMGWNGFHIFDSWAPRWENDGVQLFNALRGDNSTYGLEPVVASFVSKCFYNNALILLALSVLHNSLVVVCRTCY